MRRRLGLLLSLTLLLTCPLWAGPGVVLEAWGPTRWGMSPDTMNRLFPKGTHTANDLQRMPGHVEHYDTLILGPAEIFSGVQASQVTLVCLEGKLIQVAFRPAKRGFTGFYTFTPDDMSRLHDYFAQKYQMRGAAFGSGGYLWSFGWSEPGMRIELLPNTLYINGPGAASTPP